MGFLDILPWVLAVAATLITFVLVRKQSKMGVEYFNLCGSLTLKDNELKRREIELFGAIEKLAKEQIELDSWKREGKDFDQLISILRERLTTERLIVVRMYEGGSIGLPENTYLVPLTLTPNLPNIVGPAPKDKRCLIPLSAYSEEKDFKLPIEQTALQFASEAIANIDGRLFIAGEEYSYFQPDEN